jgi:hypothetical protein
MVFDPIIDGLTCEKLITRRLAGMPKVKTRYLLHEE